MAPPPTLIAPASSGYDELYAKWLAAGEPGAWDNLAEGTLYRAYKPNDSDPRPVFVLECSTPDLAVALGTFQLSWQGGKPLPIEDVGG